jgi:hypothetical protein
MRPLIFVLLVLCPLLGSCEKDTPLDVAPPVLEETVALGGGDCSKAKNVCTDYSVMWVDECPADSRCIAFVNSCPDSVAIGYQIGCNGDGTKGAPQCDCTEGPVLANGDTKYWKIVDGNYESCIPSWQPPCLTAGLAIMANKGSSSTCAAGSRIEFSAGNAGDIYGKFDSYNLDIEKGWYDVPVTFKPDITCANDHGAHDCRQVWCNSEDCPDAYATPTAGGCADGRSPQVGCQDTFNGPHGFTVEFCPIDCATTGGQCPSCQDAKPCGMTENFTPEVSTGGGGLTIIL